MNSGSTQAPLRVVGVHGVGHLDRYREPDAVRLAYAADWAAHLARGLGVDPGRLDLAFAYYAPALASGSVVQGADFDELGDEFAERLLMEWLDGLDAPSPVIQGVLTLPLRQVTSWIAEKFSLDGALTHVFVWTLFREVATYLRAPDSAARRAARDEVAVRIAEHRPEIVIAHSLGTVVTYEALHAYPALDVPLLITLGSPLALPHAVLERLLPAPLGGRGIRPRAVRSWINIADRGDPVAVPPHLARFFDGIDADLTATVHEGFGFHHAKNYLSCKETAGACRTGPAGG